ncbi:MAG: hypothetical protein CK428_32965 [Mycobacterium sp.]|nr:MAG: hypothetical protein CK428_32965 [Mycobacterium sp.]
MLGAPPAGVGRIDTDDRDTAAGRHCSESAAESSGGYAGHCAPQPFTAAAAAQRFTSGSAGVSEIKVLDHDRGALVRLGDVEQCGDRGPDSAVAATGAQAGSFNRDGEGFTDRIAAGIKDARGEVIGVEIHPQHGAGAQILDEPGARLRGEGPGGVQIPAATLGVEADVVAHRAAAGHPRRPLITTVCESDGGGDVQVGTEPIH